MPAIRRGRADDAADADDDPDSQQPQSDFRESFNTKVYDMVRRIPEGKVCSYGQIAKLIGQPRHSRMVGTALKCLPRHLASPFLLPPRRPSASSSAAGGAEGAGEGTGEEEEDDDAVQPAPAPNPDVVHWWRVVSQTGVISPRGSTAAVDRQADYLRAEGVVVRDGPRNGGGAAGGAEGAAEGVDAFGLGGSVAGGRVSMAKYAWKGP
ncbi:hypothetical protein JCM10207_006635 [Rhodosporidiobolus poonsookiae]